MRIRFTIAVAAGAVTIALAATLPAQHHAETHRHPAAAKLKNPVAASAGSIAAGSKLYDQHCAECHGNTGKGDGYEGEGLDKKPSDLTDAVWEHGSTDGEMFVVIRDGAGPKSDMKAFAKKLKTREMWDVVNFMRTLGPKKSHE